MKPPDKEKVTQPVEYFFHTGVCETIILAGIY